MKFLAVFPPRAGTGMQHVVVTGSARALCGIDVDSWMFDLRHAFDPNQIGCKRCVRAYQQLEGGRVKKFIEKVWVTKYALTQGILVFENVEHCTNINENMISVRDRFMTCFHGEGKEWHRTEEEAVARANLIRKAKISSLKKQITALEEKVFVVKT